MSEHDFTELTFFVFQVLESVGNALAGLVAQPEFIIIQPELVNTSEDREAKRQVMCVMESLCGIANGAVVKNVAMLTSFMLPVLADLVKLLGK